MSLLLSFKAYFSAAIYFFTLLFSIFVSPSALAFNDKDINVSPAPEWVIDNQLNAVSTIPIDDISDGVFYWMIDKQIKVSATGDQTVFSRFAEKIMNQTGVENQSQLNFDYDPAYQKLVLNSLFVLRDGEKIDRLPTVRMSLINRETELERQIYSGKLTLNLLMSDLQVGDTIDYSFTVYGSNPVYKNMFSYSRNLNWMVPVYDQHIRVLWGKPNPLFVSTRNSQLSATVMNKQDEIEYSLTIHNSDVVDIPRETPYWFSPFATIYFNEAENLNDIVEWALPLYQFDSIDPEVQKIANAIKQTHKDESAQIVAALKYTQEKVRYVGLEMGENSHAPTAPQETLALKYGDCKDKTVLLISILKALGIKASPALVDTEDTKLLSELPPGVNLFNHVIVTLMHDNKRIWLDPTLTSQIGSLSTLYQPDYGVALVVAEGVNRLTEMKNAQNASYVEITERYFIPTSNDQKVLFSVITKERGYGAISLQNKILRDGKTQLSNDYKIYYQSTYPSLITEKEIDIRHKDDTGELIIHEQYSITDFWDKKEDDFEAFFYPYMIRNEIFKPKQIKRNSPVSYNHPYNIKLSTQIEFESDDWSFEPEHFEVDNDVFTFSFDVQFKGKILTINYDYQSKTDHIPSTQVDEYIEARERIFNKAYYGLIKYGKKTTVNAATDNQVKEADETSPWLVLLGLLYSIGLLFIIISWRLESKKRPQFNNENFYSMSLIKFILLSVSTFGLYNSYWMYRNWKAIKAKRHVTIMPIGRGIFSCFWFYPLFIALKIDSVERYGKNIVMPSLIAALLAILYFFIVLTADNYNNYYSFLCYLFIALLCIPFVNYLNSPKVKDDALYAYNDKWYLRHIIIVVLFLPILLLSVAEQIPFLPADSIVTESDMLNDDLQYLYRQQVLPANETILYFYSDAFFSAKKEGNGLTEQRVFSYWVDQQGQFQKEAVTFDNVKNITTKFTEESNENSIITITRLDDSEFLLFVSEVDNGDHIFVKALEERWKAND